MSLAGCSGLQSSQSMVNPQGLQAARIDHLFWLIFWVCIIAFVLTIAALSRAVLKRRETPVENFRPVDKRETTKTRVVAVAIAITVISLFGLLVSSILTGKAIASLHPQNPLTIEVVGHQWWWEIRYPNSDASKTVITA